MVSVGRRGGGKHTMKWMEGGERGSHREAVPIIPVERAKVQVRGQMHGEMKEYGGTAAAGNNFRAPEPVLVGFLDPRI